MSTCGVPVLMARLVCYYISVAKKPNLINHFTLIVMLAFFIRTIWKLHCNVYHKLGYYFFIPFRWLVICSVVRILEDKKKITSKFGVSKRHWINGISREGDLPPETIDGDQTPSWLCACVDYGYRIRYWRVCACACVCRYSTGIYISRSQRVGFLTPGPVIWGLLVRAP